MPTKSSSINKTPDRSWVKRSSSYPARGRRMDTAGSQLEIPADSNNNSCNSCSSHTMQTTPTWDWSWTLQTTDRQIQNTNRNKEHWSPNQTSWPNLRQQQPWRISRQLEIWHPKKTNQITMRNCQIKREWLFWWTTEQQDHCSNIYISMLGRHQHMQS